MQQNEKVKPKKKLGQHFLNSETIAQRIVDAMLEQQQVQQIIEVGPGMGVLTKYLIQSGVSFYALDVDEESVEYLKNHYSSQANQFLLLDFLQADLSQLFKGEFGVIGNFPYNISTQIVFKILEQYQNIPVMVGMFQKEVAERICSTHGSKEYGITSVLTQLLYDTTYLFTVNEGVFTPPPKVKSGVIKLVRKQEIPNVNHKLFIRVVKAGFNQRRKKLRNAIAQFGVNDSILQPSGFADKRAEQLSVDEFIQLTQLVEQHGKQSN